MKNISISLLKRSRIEKESESDSIESFSEIDLFIHISRWLSHLGHEREVRLNLNNKGISIWKKKTVYTLTLFSSLSFVDDFEETSFSSSSFSSIFIRLRLRLDAAVFLIFLILLARKIVDFLSFLFLFVFSFAAIAFFASVLIFVTSTRFRVSSLSDRRSFESFSFTSSTKRDQSRCVR